MTLPSTGSISMSQIQAEFGGSNPISLSEYYGVTDGIPTSGTISMSQFRGKSVPAGQQVFTGSGLNASTTSWTVPAGVTRISIITVGGGGSGGAGYWNGAGGGGGGLCYANNVSVTPGEVLTVVSGRGGSGVKASQNNGNGYDGGESYVKKSNGTRLCEAKGGEGGEG